MKTFLQLIQYKNLLLLAFIQLLFRYGFLEIQNVPLALSDINFMLIVFSTVFLAAGGAIINAIVDFENTSVEINEKSLIDSHFSIGFAYNAYIALTIVGVVIGFYLSNYIGKPGFSSLFIIIAVLLYLYASTLKNKLIINNLTIAVLYSISILFVGFFDLLLTYDETNKAILTVLFKILLDYSFLTFFIVFIREIIKNLEEEAIDQIKLKNTLPRSFGIKKTKMILVSLSLIPLFSVGYYCYFYFWSSALFYSCGYALTFTISPLIYFMVTLVHSKKEAEFRYLYNLLNLILVLSLLSILVVSLEIYYHV